MRDFLMCENLLDVIDSPHHGSSRFCKKKEFIITIDIYLFLDSRFIYLISTREEHRRYVMIRIV